MGAKYQKLILPLIIILGLVLRIISLNQSLWFDEAINVLATQNFSFLGMITEYAKADFHPPGYFIIVWIWAKLFGIDPSIIRIPSVLMGVLTIYVVYLIANKLHSKTLGLLSAFLLAINPLHIFYSQEARMYPLSTLAVSVNIFLLVKLIKGEKLNIFFLILSNFLVLVSDYVAYFIFPAQLFFILMTKKREIIKKWFAAIFSAVLLFSPWLPIFLSQLNMGAITSERLPTWKFVVGGFDVKAIPLTFVKFIIGRISYPDKLIYAGMLLPVSILFSFLVLKGVGFITSYKRNILIAWLIIPIILASLISVLIPIYSYFRLLFVLPVFVMLISVGILSIKSKLQYFFLSLVILIEIFSAGVYLFNPNYQREDWRGLVNYLKLQDPQSLTLFESSGVFPAFEYFSKGSVNAKGALNDFPALNEGNLIDFKQVSSKDIYLIDYLVQISDPQRLVDKKLKNSGYTIVEIKDFHGVGFLFHYKKND